MGTGLKGLMGKRASLEIFEALFCGTAQHTCTL